MRVEASEHSSGTEALSARLQDDAAALVGATKSATISGTAKAVYTYGGTADTWTASPTAAMVKDADFGVRLWFTTAHDVRVDYVTCAIEYTAPSAAVEGTAAGTSTVTGTITGTGAIAGTAAGTSTVTGTATGIGAIAGAAEGTSTVSGTVTDAPPPGEVAGMAAGTSTVSGTITGVGAIAASSSGTSAVDGTITGLGAILGLAAGVAVVVGTLSGTGDIAGSAAGISTVSGTIVDANAPAEEPPAYTEIHDNTRGPRFNRRRRNIGG